MESKKYSLLAGIFCLFASYGISQTTTGSGTGYDVSDSSVIPAKRMPQHTEFMNGTYNFPARPRDQWEVGVKAGAFSILGDVKGRPSFGAGLHIRKALGYLVSLRLEYMYGQGKGMNYASSTNYERNPAWNTNLPVAQQYVANAEPVFYNYKTTVHDLALEGLFTLNNVRFHKAKPSFIIYALVGVGATIYDAKVNALGDNGQKYNFASIPSGTYKERGQTRDRIKDLANWDDDYETDADNDGTGRPMLFDRSFRPVGHLGGGIAFKVGKNVNIAIEDRFTIINDDVLDGQRWAEQVPSEPVLSSSKDFYNYLSVGFNFNLGKKSVEPLYWINPLNYPYSEIRNPRLMRLPKPVLPDTDGDGVTDQFDQEQTPAGCPVDTHGVSRDTDGDGVPDCRDKELVTPTYCQPVDADGVGKCPCPEGCMTARPTDSSDCATSLGALPSITFAGTNSVALSNDARSMLASVAARLRNNPNCRVVVTGYCASSKSEQQRSWDRVNAVINYMVEREGISADRLFFNYGQEGGDCNTVDLRTATADEQGQTTVPAPHPNLRKNN